MGRPVVSVVSGFMLVCVFVTLGQIWRISLLSNDPFLRRNVTPPSLSVPRSRLVLSVDGRFTKSRVVLNNITNRSTKPFYGSLLKDSNISKLYSNARVVHPPPTVLQLLDNIQGAQWAFNDSAIESLRVRLENATRTSEQFILTRQNAPLGTDINFSAQNGKFTITDRIFHAEQETSPLANRTFDTCSLVGNSGVLTGSGCGWDLRFRSCTSPLANRTFDTCSLVGNSGVLTGSGCGREIDKADFVIRFNLPPVIAHWREDIGTKTHLVTTNVHTIVSKFHHLPHNLEWVQAFRNFIRNCNLQNTHIFTFPFNVRGNGDFFLTFQETLKSRGITNKVLMNHPHHRRLTSRFWAEEGLNEPTPTSGFYLVSAALAFCRHVRIFGFWPFLTDRRQRALQYHYTLNYLHQDGGLNNWNHRIDREFFKLVELYRDGIVELVTDTCG